MDQVRLGIIGAGAIVEKKHLPALAEVPEIAVQAVCRRNSGQLHQIADRFRIADRHTDYRAVLDDPRIDAVLIATGPPAQGPIVLDAAAARKHIFVEKPLAETSDEARMLCEAVRTAGVQFQVGFNKRFYYGYQQAKRLVAAGELDRLSGIHARFWFQPGRRDGLLHNGIHFLDLVQFFMGPATNVFASRSTTKEATGETLVVSLEFQDGGVGSLLLSSLASWDYPNEHLDLVGANHAALSVEGGRQVRLFRRGPGRPAELYENTLSVHWWSGHEEQGFIPQLREFVRRIRDGDAALHTTPDSIRTAAGPSEGIASLALLEAVRNSMAQRAPVAVSPGNSDWAHTAYSADPASARENQA